MSARDARGPEDFDVPSLHPAAIVRRLAHDVDVVDMALAQARAGDAQELPFLLQLLDGGAAGVAHCRAQAADQLMDDVADRALVGHAALYAFGHQLQRALDLLLEVAVGRAARHGADRAHAAVRLVGTALVEDDLARR